MVGEERRGINGLPEERTGRKRGPKPHEDGPYVFSSVILAKRQIDLLDDIARKTGRSRSSLIREAIDSYLTQRRLSQDLPHAPAEVAAQILQRFSPTEVHLIIKELNHGI